MEGITLEELKENFNQQNEGDFAYSYNDVQRYGYHMPLGIKDWQIVFSMEKSVMDSHVQRLSSLVAVTTIINWVFLGVMLWSVYRYYKSVNREMQIAHQRISRSNEIISTVGSAEDISRLVQGEAAIKRKEELHETLVKTSILYGRVDLSAGMICELNGKKTNQSYSAFLEDKVRSDVCVEHHSYVMQALSLETLLEEYHLGKEYIEVQCKIERNHEIKWVSILVYRVHENEGNNVTVVIQDIDQKKRRELALKEQAEIDGLTGLYNAATIRSKIRDLLALPHMSEEKQIFILFDLDNFKKINDTFGHAAGDQALIDVAAKLKKRFRSTDILGRLGGDEFLMVLCDVNSDQYVEKITQSLGAALVQTYTKGDISITVTVSMGIAISPQDGITFEELYKKSDAALYEVKKNGKNGCKRWTE